MSETSRREFFRQGGRLLVLSAAAAGAWESILAGRPEAAEAYRAADHWWGMAIDIEKCIGCGNCVRACKEENDVPRDPRFFRTWVERYHVLPDDLDRPVVDSPDGGYDGFPEKYTPGDGSKNFFVPKLCNHCADSPCVQVCPYGCRFIDPRTETVDKCSLCYHRITRGLTTACCETCPTGARQLGDLKDPKDPIHAFLREHQVHVLKPQMATHSKVYYNGLDGSVR
jgi:tetrathionate reductase subunit B